MAQQAPNSKIDDAHGIRLSAKEQVRVIRLLTIDGLSVRIVARRFGVSITTIARIRNEYLLVQKKVEDGE